MVNSVVNTLCQFGYVRDEQLKTELSTKSMHQLILDYILPFVVEVGGQDTRGWRLSPRFMKLMTKHAQDFIREDRELGEMLFELALQRIQRHPELKAIDYRGILPEVYKKYSAAYDQPGLWGDEEWEFMQKRLQDGLYLSNKAYRTHCEELILDILAKIAPGENDWYGMKTVVPNGALYELIVKLATLNNSPSEVALCLLHKAKGYWRRNKQFYAQFASELDWEEFFLKIDLDEEQYYRGFSRFMLKLFGRYDKATKKRVREEICKA